ncbi:MAG: T9SS type A sorting domain-containing protein [candidate division WOR-3 bacterium]|nr:MAG: T9SS type A sorting domain-containing protein [candidate division WOR-3 bacterium]
MTLVVALSLIVAELGRGSLSELPFDVNGVVTQVSGASPCADSGQFLLDTNVAYGSSAQAQSYPAVAYNGSVYLVVWTDHRCSFKDDIFGARLSSEGVLLDSAGILVSAEPVNQARPSVACDGVDFLVVWSDTRTGDYDIYGARVSSAGEVLEPHGFVVCGFTGYQQNPSVANSDSLCLVVWQDARGGSTFDIYSARVSKGAVLDSSGILISDATDNQQYPALSGKEADGWLVTWQDRRSGDYDIFGARVGQDGSVLDPAGVPVSTASQDQADPAVGFDSIWLVAWTDKRSGGLYSDLYGARVNEDGKVLDSIGIPVSTAGNSQGYPSVAAGHGNFYIAWNDGRSYPDYNVYGARLNRSGTVLEPNGVLLSGADGTQSSPAVTVGDTNWLAVWSDARGGNSWAVYGARVSQQGTVLDPNGVHTSPLVYNQFEPDVAFDGSNYLAVWGDYRAGTNRDIYGCRVTPQGEILDPAGIGICTQGNWQGVATVGFDGTNYLVAWSDLRTGDFDIYGTRVSPQGEVLDPGGIPIARIDQIQLYPDVAWNGANWLVAYHDWRNHEYDIYGTRVASDGTVLDPNSIAISRADRNQYHPVVASDGSKCFVVWDDTRGGSSRIHGARVSRDGVVLDTNGVAVSSASSYIPAIAFDGENYLVTWDDYRTGSADVYGARITPSGAVLDPNGLPLSTAPNYQKASALAFDGTSYLVAWEDWRNGHDYDLYAARVSTAGSVLETFAVQTWDQEQISAAVANGPGEQMLVVWSGWIDSVNHRVANTHRIWGWLDGVAGMEERSAETPGASALLAASPNPFGLNTAIRWKPVSGSDERLSIYDAGGMLVRSFASSTGLVLWDGRDEAGKRLSAGIYICRLQARNTSSTRKLVMQR